MGVVCAAIEQAARRAAGARTRLPRRLFALASSSPRRITTEKCLSGMFRRVLRDATGVGADVTHFYPWLIHVDRCHFRCYKREIPTVAGVIGLNSLKWDDQEKVSAEQAWRARLSSVIAFALNAAYFAHHAPPRFEASVWTTCQPTPWLRSRAQMARVVLQQSPLRLQLVRSESR